MNEVLVDFQLLQNLRTHHPKLRNMAVSDLRAAKIDQYESDQKYKSFVFHNCDVPMKCRVYSNKMQNIMHIQELNCLVSCCVRQRRISCFVFLLLRKDFTHLRSQLPVLWRKKTNLGKAENIMKLDDSDVWTVIRTTRISAA